VYRPAEGCGVDQSVEGARVGYKQLLRCPLPVLFCSVAASAVADITRPFATHPPLIFPSSQRRGQVAAPERPGVPAAPRL
jgi:hypothetical protein